MGNLMPDSKPSEPKPPKPKPPKRVWVFWEPSDWQDNKVNETGVAWTEKQMRIFVKSAKPGTTCAEYVLKARR